MAGRMLASWLARLVQLAGGTKNRKAISFSTFCTSLKIWAVWEAVWKAVWEAAGKLVSPKPSGGPSAQL